MKRSYRIVILLVFVALGPLFYIRIWELQQPKVELKKVCIVEILPYRQTAGDLHWSYKGYRIYIKGDKRTIDFAKKNWNESIEINDSVNMVVRQSFFGNELDGLRVEKIEGKFH